MSITLKRAVPTFRMFDVAKAREFYVDYLGFSVDFEHRFGDNAPLFMGISRGDIVFFLSEHHGDGAPGLHVVVQMEGIDELHRELAAMHYKYMKPGIQTQEWGTRELRVYDPFNNQITFSEPIAGES
jgi:catechol 2,3-dioxygenase-like lactoylglutathione lyase family enzyme